MAPLWTRNIRHFSPNKLFGCRQYQCLNRQENEFYTEPSLASTRSANNTSPRLMNLHQNEVIWPSFFFNPCAFQMTSLIRHHFDRSFSMSQFSKDAKNLVVAISSHLAQGNTEGLENIVEPSTLEVTMLKQYDWWNLTWFNKYRN